MKSASPMVATLFVLLSSCTTAQTPPSTGPASLQRAIDQCAESASLYTLNAVLWQQTSVEYRAVAAQTYANARLMLDRALADPTWNALPDVNTRAELPPAVVLDLDETAFDNWRYQAELLQRGEMHNDERFGRFEAAGGAEAVEGSVEFLQYAASRGVKVFYVTNRDDLVGGRRSLEQLGFPVTDDSLLFKAARPEWDTSDKTSRREWVAARHRVLILLGDDFNDFVLAHGKSIDERNALFVKHKNLFGTKWFALPNAMYGSWEGAVTAGAKTPREKCAAKYRVLTSGN